MLIQYHGFKTYLLQSRVLEECELRENEEFPIVATEYRFKTQGFGIFAFLVLSKGSPAGRRFLYDTGNLFTLPLLGVPLDQPEYKVSKLDDQAFCDPSCGIWLNHRVRAISATETFPGYCTTAIADPGNIGGIINFLARGDRRSVIVGCVKNDEFKNYGQWVLDDVQSPDQDVYKVRMIPGDLENDILSPDFCGLQHVDRPHLLKRPRPNPTSGLVPISTKIKRHNYRIPLCLDSNGIYQSACPLYVSQRAYMSSTSHVSSPVYANPSQLQKLWIMDLLTCPCGEILDQPYIPEANQLSLDQPTPMSCLERRKKSESGAYLWTKRRSAYWPKEFEILTDKVEQ